MKNIGLVLLGGLITFLLSFTVNTIQKTDIIAIKTAIKKNNNLKLGAFSISLTVKDLKTSRAFYENLGFTILGGGMEMNYLILKNENAIIGLFQGMFEGNIITFNPGWDENGKNIKKFDDVRVIQENIKKKGIQVMGEADLNSKGPAGIMITDPDGNMILIDQHR